MKKICVAVNPKVEGYTEAVIDKCDRIKSRLDYYKNKIGEPNKSKKVFKLVKIK